MRGHVATLAFVGVVDVSVQIVIWLVVHIVCGARRGRPRIARRSKPLRLVVGCSIGSRPLGRCFIPLAIGPATAPPPWATAAFFARLARCALRAGRIAVGLGFALSALPALRTIASCIGRATHAGLQIQLLVAFEIEVGFLTRRLDVCFMAGRGRFTRRARPARFVRSARLARSTASSPAAATAASRHVLVLFLVGLGP